MAISITSIDQLNQSKKTRNVYDNYDNLYSVVTYDKDQNVDTIVKTSSNIPGKTVETKLYQQIQIDVVRDPVNITSNSARLRPRIYKNDNSKVFETGIIYWFGNTNSSILNKRQKSDIFQEPSVYKGNFSITIDNLKQNQVYNYRAFVRHEYGTNYSKVYQFTTQNEAVVFKIEGDRFQGPVPLTVNLSAENAGFGDFTYAWNMTGGQIGFQYPLNSISVTNIGAGYTPLATNYILNSITLTLTGVGYDNIAEILVLVNGSVAPELTANFGYNNSLSAYGVSSINVPVAGLSGYQTNTLVVTFSSANSSTITQVASGVGNTTSYTVPRENKILVDGVYQPSLSAVMFLNPETGYNSISAIQFLSGSLIYTNSNTRAITLSTNGPVLTAAALTPNTSKQITNADYLTRTITHTYSAAGNFVPKVWAILNGDQIDKSAVRTVRVAGSTDYSQDWQPVLTAPFANNIVAAYDFRNLAGTPGLNEYTHALYDFESINQQEFGNQYNVDVRTRSPLMNFDVNYNLNIAGYLFFGGELPVSVAGYGVGGYDRSFIYGPGLTENSRSARFQPLTAIVGGYLGGYDFNTGGYAFNIAGYPVRRGQRWFDNQGSFAFNTGNPFTISMWLNYNYQEPGSRIFSILPFGYWNNQYEFTVTQSTSALSIFKNAYLNEQIAGYFTQDPVGFAGYRSGFPVMYTEDAGKLLTPNEWSHLVISRDKNNLYKYYKNGVLMLSALDSGFGGYDTLIGSVTMGGYSNYGGQFGFGQLTSQIRSHMGGYSYINIGNTAIIGTETAPPSGLIDSVGIWQKTLKDSDVVDLYNAGTGTDFGYLRPIVGPKLYLGGLLPFSNYGNTVPSTMFETDGDSYIDNVSLYARFDGAEGSTSFVDSSVNNVLLSSFGAVITTNTKKYGTGSAVFSANQIGGYIQTLSSADFGAFGSDDFTIEWWEYTTHYNSYYPIMFYGNPGVDRRGSTSVFRPQWGIFRTIGGYPAVVAGYTSNGLAGTVVNFVSESPIGGYYNTYTFRDDNITNTGGFQLSAWSHNVIQRRSGNINYYKNGIGGYGGFNSSNFRVGAPVNIAGYDGNGTIGAGFIGGYIPNTTDYSGEIRDLEWHYYPGHIDELRITKGVGRYSSNFTVPTSSYPQSIGDVIATRFRRNTNYGGSYALARETVPITYPHTVAFIGNVNSTGSNGNTVLQNTQTSYFDNSNNSDLGDGNQNFTGAASLIRPFTGGAPGMAPTLSRPDGRFIGGYIAGYGNTRYIPTGNEWFYIAYSWLGPNSNNNIRYYLQTPTLTGSGLIGGYEAINLAGYPGYGIGGYAFKQGGFPLDAVVGGYNNINGLVRLGVHINQGFETHEDMVSLFSALTAGPADDLKLV
jgi:hypothetical protein